MDTSGTPIARDAGDRFWTWIRVYVGCVRTPDNCTSEVADIQYIVRMSVLMMCENRGDSCGPRPGRSGSQRVALSERAKSSSRSGHSRLRATLPVDVLVVLGVWLLRTLSRYMPGQHGLDRAFVSKDRPRGSCPVARLREESLCSVFGVSA